MTFNYPNHVPNYGNLTEKIMKEFILNYYHKQTLENKEITSLIASNDITKPLYFWQLYSILGEKYIEDLIRLFYTKLFGDTKNKWFSDEFIEIGSIEYHVRGQKKFWLDIMGGGEYYSGGEKKLHNYHKLVKNIMTSEGAHVWMKHMNDALDEMIYNEDVRVRKCMDVFLKYFMTKYAIEFDFNFFSIMKTKL
jgi:truncated hemoglobin YjbI